jgi:hypothetical protein
MTVDENKMYTWLFIKKINIIYDTTQVFTFEFYWLLFNVNSAIFQLYHGEKKLIFNEMMLRFRFVLDQHTE